MKSNRKSIFPIVSTDILWRWEKVESTFRSYFSVEFLLVKQAKPQITVSKHTQTQTGSVRLANPWLLVKNLEKVPTFYWVYQKSRSLPNNGPTLWSHISSESEIAALFVRMRDKAEMIIRVMRHRESLPSNDLIYMSTKRLYYPFDLEMLIKVLN